MPKESQRNYRSHSCHHGNHFHGRPRHRKHTPTKERDSVRISKDQYSVVIQSCEEMLSNIRSQIDLLRAEHRPRDHDDDSCRVASSSSSSCRSFETLSGLVPINGQHSAMNSDRRDNEISNFLPRLPPLYNLGKPTHSPRKSRLEDIVRDLEDKSKLKASVTKNSIDNVMSLSSSCQLQLLEVSLQCPLSQAKIKVPIKTTTCQHLRCFDAESFLSIMIGSKKLSLWKCPICSACAELDKLVVDEFLQEIINTTPQEAMKIEFTSSVNWRVKKETGTPVSVKSQPKELIDLTYSPRPKSVLIDLTDSP